MEKSGCINKTHTQTHNSLYVCQIHPQPQHQQQKKKKKKKGKKTPLEWGREKRVSFPLGFGAAVTLALFPMRRGSCSVFSIVAVAFWEDQRCKKVLWGFRPGDWPFSLITRGSSVIQRNLFAKLLHLWAEGLSGRGCSGPAVFLRGHRWLTLSDHKQTILFFSLLLGSLEDNKISKSLCTPVVWTTLSLIKTSNNVPWNAENLILCFPLRHSEQR